ncbi:MAG: hypothetical protein ACD_63C00054G0001 [uncultured bacterium]|nr:MAG: hypothetical protein ACD_63C00054G0001 [uncultured bacterium]
MNKGTIVGIIVVVIVAIIVVVWFLSLYNFMVKKDLDVDNAWSQVENQYQRRADLIPNLVETVKGFAKQELTVFTEVTEMRSRWTNAQNQEEQINAAEGLDNAIGRLLVVVEDYPELKSDENFLKLQDQLEGTENRIAVERKRYNDVVTAFNKTIKTWPNKTFARWFGFEDRKLFKAEEGVEKVPEVKF